MAQRSKGTSQRLGRWGRAMVMTAFVGVGTLVGSLMLPQTYASAATTAVSTLYTTGTNTVDGSTAASPEAPGGVKTGTTKPGDTLNWVVSYQNNTGADASVNLTDILASAGYVPGSLRLPPNGNAVGSLTPQYTTNGGTSWVSGTPPSNANGVGFTGTMVPQGTQQKSVSIPSIPALQVSGGDGYNAVVSADGLRVYAVFPRHTNDSGGNPLYCAVIATGAVCPGWPAQSSFVPGTAGSALGQNSLPPGSGPLMGAQSGAFITSSNILMWAYSGQAAGQIIGFNCLNLTTLISCGFTPVGTTPVAVGATTGALIGGTGLPASDGNYWYQVGTGIMACMSPSGTACGTVNVGAAVTTAQPITSATFGDRVVGMYSSGGTMRLYCSMVGGSVCAGFPVTVAAAAGASFGEILPILNTAGTLTGVCSAPLFGSGANTCWNLAGSPISNPYPAGFGPAGVQSPTDALIRGTKVYTSWGGDAVGCFDFATNALCAGFANPSNPQNSTVRDASAVAANCLVANSDGGGILFFNALTGGSCMTTTSPVSMTVTPSSSYCGSGSAGFRSWGTLTIPGLVAGTYTDSTVTLRDQNNAIITGFNGVALAAGGSLDLSSIGTSVTSITATVTVNGVNDPSGVTTGQVAITWVGDPPEMCFQTITPPRPCVGIGTSPGNSVTAVTTSAAGSDAPTGNRTGAATFTNTADTSQTSSQCVLVYEKTASTQSARPGDKVTYTITVTNAGTQAYNSLANFTDDLTDVVNDATYNGDAAASAGAVSYTAPTLAWSGGLAAGATATITYSVTVHSPDTGDHTLKNTVVSTAVGNNNCRSGSADTRCTATVPISDLSVTKTADSSALQSPAQLGDVITYHFSSTNTGQTTLTGVAITDLHPGLSPLRYTWPGVEGTLSAGQTVTATATYALTQSDVDNGTVVNSAIASGNPPTGPPATSPPSGATVPVVQGSDLTFTKTADPSGVSSPARAGDVISYTFTASNDGNATLTGVDIDDSLPGLSPLAYSWPGLPGTLAPGEQVTATATYHLTQADIDNQGVANTATVTGTPPTGPDVSDSSAAFVSVSAAPGLGLVKTANASAVQSPAAVGDTITYSFTATNTGNSTLSGVSITDPLPGLSALMYTWPGAPGTLAPGEEVTATATYVLGQADLDAGHIANAATAAGTPPGGAPIVTPSSQTDTPLITASSIALVKSGTGPVGNTVTYNFAATNTGTVTLTGVTISDLLPGLSALTYSWPQTPGVLTPGQTVTATATYQVTPADIAAGHISNTASATGTSLSGPVLTDTATADVPVTAAPAPGLTLLKAADTSAVQSPAMVGDTITYHFVATNSGNVPLTGVTIADALPGLSALTYSWPGAPGTLAPGEAVTATATYRLTADDIAAGHVANAANASGSDPSGRTLTTPFASVDTPLLRSEMPTVSG